MARITSSTPKPEGPKRDWTALPFTAFADLLGVPLTLPQRVLCKIGFEGKEPGELEGEEFEIGQRLLKPPEQEAPVLVVPPGARRVLTLVKGGRCGGTYLSALYGAHRGLVADLSTLAPGERGRGIFGGPDLDLAGQAMSYAVGAYQSHPELEGLIVGTPTASRFVIERPHDGRQVEFVTRAASRGGKTFRSRSLIFATLTEVAFFLSSEHVVNDEDCFRAVNPRVLPGGLTILESTAFAEAGLLFNEFDANFGKPSTSLALHAPTLFLLPTERNKAVVEAEERRDPENALREFGGQFIPFGSSVFFPREVIKRSTMKGVGKETAPGPGELAGVGGDFGLTRDAAGFCAVHRIAAETKKLESETAAGYTGSTDERRDPKKDRYRVQECIERRPSRGVPLRLKDLVPLACALAQRHGQKSILVDGWSLQAARENLDDAVTGTKGYTLDSETNVDEADMYEAVLELMKAGQVEIPEGFTALLRQLPLVLSKPTPGGGKKIVLPRKFGAHCDLVPAFVKAVWKAKRADVGGRGTKQPEGLRSRAAHRTGGY